MQETDCMWLACGCQELPKYLAAEHVWLCQDQREAGIITNVLLFLFLVS